MLVREKLELNAVLSTSLIPQLLPHDAALDPELRVRAPSDQHAQAARALCPRRLLLVSALQVLFKLADPELEVEEARSVQRIHVSNGAPRLVVGGIPNAVNSGSGSRTESRSRSGSGSRSGIRSGGSALARFAALPRSGQKAGTRLFRLWSGCAAIDRRLRSGFGVLRGKRSGVPALFGWCKRLPSAIDAVGTLVLCGRWLGEWHSCSTGCRASI
mmetsp:Transcript_24114/g.61631  ORF Transcript_24114/g.61631 Transcript_24114/m.61631 type:complete len:215 (-) Transcript_24114:314-958(-)